MKYKKPWNRIYRFKIKRRWDKVCELTEEMKSGAHMSWVEFLVEYEKAIKGYGDGRGCGNGCGGGWGNGGGSGSGYGLWAMVAVVAVAMAMEVAMVVAVVNFKEIRMIWMILGFVSVVLFMGRTLPKQDTTTQYQAHFPV